MEAKLWHDMFVLGLPVLEKILRPAIVYLFLVVALRLAGKREMAQLNPLDLVVLLTLSNTVQNAIIGDDNTVTGGLLGATTLLVLNYLLVRMLYGHQKIERLVEGTEDVLIEKGKLIPARLREDLITLPELETAAHRQGFASLDNVERAVLEPGGTLAFIGKKPAPEEARHSELLDRLEQIAQELGRLRAHPPAPSP